VEKFENEKVKIGIFGHLNILNKLHRRIVKEFPETARISIKDSVKNLNEFDLIVTISTPVNIFVTDLFNKCNGFRTLLHL
jgi:hypothetical protein